MIKKTQSWLLDKFLEFSDRRALVDKNGSYSYRELYDQILIYIDVLEKENIKENQIVIIQSDYNFHAICHQS